MKFTPALVPAIFLRRYKRFMADVRLEDGSEITVHCPNTGSMRHCLVPESPCFVLDSQNPKRKYRHTWELASASPEGWAGVNTARANPLVAEALERGWIAELTGYPVIKREQKYGDEGSRIDFLLLGSEGEQCFVEVKSVTLAAGGGAGLFPDAVSERGAKHLRELISVVAAGNRAVLLFCVQHTAIEQVSPADQIDPVYGQTLRSALAAGVEVLAYGVRYTPQLPQAPESVVLDRPLAVRVPD